MNTADFSVMFFYNLQLIHNGILRYHIELIRVTAYGMPIAIIRVFKTVFLSYRGVTQYITTWQSFLFSALYFCHGYMFEL